MNRQKDEGENFIPLWKSIKLQQFTEEIWRFKKHVKDDSTLSLKINSGPPEVKFSTVKS